MDNCASHNKNTQGPFILQIWHDSRRILVGRNSYLNRGSCESCQLFNMLALLANNSTDSLSWDKEVDHLLFRSLLRRGQKKHAKYSSNSVWCCKSGIPPKSIRACDPFTKVVCKNVHVSVYSMGNPPHSHWDTAHFSAGWKLSPEGSHRFVRRQKHSIHHESDVENTNLLSVSKEPDLPDTHVWTIGNRWLIVQTLGMGDSDILKRSQRFFIHKLTALACGAQYCRMEKEVVIWWITTKLFIKMTWDIAVALGYSEADNCVHCPVASYCSHSILCQLQNLLTHCQWIRNIFCVK